MFKSNKGMVAMALFTSQACAMKFRPIPGTVPWHDGPASPEWVDPKDHDVGYGVPNFGADSDINASMKNLAYAEEYHKHQMAASFDAPATPPRDYFVPHFGEDDDIKATKKNTAYAEGYHQHEMSTAPPPAGPPRDYFVPHFGEDTDIKDAKSNIAKTEKKLGHELDTSPAPADPPRNYFVPHFGEDEDITFTKRNIASAEKAHGVWDVKRDGNGAWILPSVKANQYGNYKGENNWPDDKLESLVQTDANIETKSDPICSSAGCTQYKHKKKDLGYKINYFVPHFGTDNDINDNFASIKTAEGIVGAEFQIGTAASKAKWKNPAKKVDYNFRPTLDGDVISTQKNLDDAEKTVGHKWIIDDVQLDSDIKLDSDQKSDPICSSAGCTQYKHKTKDLGYKINYFVPNFGADHLINQNHDSLDWAEKSLGHHWVWKDDKDEKIPEYHFKAMDPDIVDSLKHLKDQEAQKGAWNLGKDDYFQVQLDADVNSDPICSSAGCDQYKHKKKARGYDINYPVPNFGVDKDIIDSHASLAVSEDALAHKLEMGTEKSKAKWHNVAKDTDYNFAPKLDADMIHTAKHLGDAESSLGHKWVIDDVQLDSEVNSDPICSSAGCDQYKHKKKARGYDINYPVPNFGVDRDIIDSHASLAISEDALAHKLEMGTEKSKAKWHNVAKDTDYNFAPKLDADMIHTAKHLGDAETSLGHKWVIDDVQLDSEVNSDPICSSAGCDQYKHKKKARGYDINYPVPNFGVDRDIIDSHASLAISEDALAHKLEMGTEKSKAKWHNVAKDTDYNFAPKLDADMIHTAKHLGDAETSLGHKWVIDDLQINSDVHSDPICASSGCPKSAWTEAEEDKIVQYPVDQPHDEDVVNTLAHEGAASTALGHVWVPYGY